MPHQCTKCGKFYPDAAPELLSGCVCGARFFFYVREEALQKRNEEVKETLEHLNQADLEQIETDIREITGLDKEPEKPVVLDIESVRVISPGKFEIDLVKLMSKKVPLIYKIGEGKYIIDLATSLNQDKNEIRKRLKQGLKDNKD
jgi:predicted  nucleic acid-binding Zn-ribbon protein